MASINRNFNYNHHQEQLDYQQQVQRQQENINGSLKQNQTSLNEFINKKSISNGNIKTIDNIDLLLSDTFSSTESNEITESSETLIERVIPKNIVNFIQSIFDSTDPTFDLQKSNNSNNSNKIKMSNLPHSRSFNPPSRSIPNNHLFDIDRIFNFDDSNNGGGGGGGDNSGQVLQSSSPFSTRSTTNSDILFFDPQISPPPPPPPSSSSSDLSVSSSDTSSSILKPIAKNLSEQIFGTRYRPPLQIPFLTSTTNTTTIEPTSISSSTTEIPFIISTSTNGMPNFNDGSNIIIDIASNTNQTTTATTTTSTEIGNIFLFPNLNYSTGPQCYHSPENYDLITSMLCSSLFVLGIVYFTYGYRCFRALSFFVSMIFASTLFYIVCAVEHIELLHDIIPNGTLLISILVGIFVGFLAMLVTFCGLFIIGIHFGLLMSFSLLIVIYILRPYYLILQAPLSALTILIFFVALSLVAALTTVYYSKGCTILASSMYGSALSLLCADYFLENFLILNWFLDQLSNGDNDWYGLLENINRGQQLCIGSIIMLLIWPILILFGIVIQGCCTARNYQYRRGYGMVIDGDIEATPSFLHTSNHSLSRDNIRSFNFNHFNSNVNNHWNNHLLHQNSINSNNSKVNSSSNLEEQRLEQRQRKYRYLYQVRTAHGDVISQQYLQSLQNKKPLQSSSTSSQQHQQLCLPDQDSFTFASDISSGHFCGGVGQSESRTTTLSVA